MALELFSTQAHGVLLQPVQVYPLGAGRTAAANIGPVSAAPGPAAAVAAALPAAALLLVPAAAAFGTLAKVGIVTLDNLSP